MTNYEKLSKEQIRFAICKSLLWSPNQKNFE